MALVGDDPFLGASGDFLSCPASRGVAHTASATAFAPTRGFHAQGTETIVVDFKDGGAAVSLAVVEGATYPYRITKCSTTTSGIVLLY